MTNLDLIINQFILEAGKLYTLPELYQQLDEQIRSETSSINDISELLETDAALSAKILRLANCPLYGFQTEITTINRALNLIGLKEVKNLILMDTVAQNFSKNDKYSAVHMEEFWKRSVYIALIAKKLAQHVNHSEPERLFICGIMSRIGQLVACMTRQKEVVTIVHRCQNEPEHSELLIEYNTLGFTFNQISAALLKHWKVPDEITVPIGSLHYPQLDKKSVPDNFVLESYILYTAINYTQQLGLEDVHAHEPLETAATDIYLNSVDNEINQVLSINKTVIEDILFEIEIDALEILSVVFPKTASIF